MIYREISPIENRIQADRQTAKRHYGVHPYFTRRPYNVVANYITHYSNAGDKVLDPFGGSGVTAIEAFLNNRVGIHNDINPLANFIAGGIADLSKGTPLALEMGLTRVLSETEPTIRDIQATDEGELVKKFAFLSLPKNIELPQSSDVRFYYELFSKRQLFSLAAIKFSIDRLKDPHVRSALLLAWSASLAKLNKTFLSAEGRLDSRGGSSIFSIYRYKVAKDPIELPPFETFKERAGNVIAAKHEILREIELRDRRGGFCGLFQCVADDIHNLGDRFSEQIDYIFTDPPYGGHISYIDLSTLWNAWLGQTPNLDVRRQELIVGGDLGLTEQHYIDGLKTSIESCMGMLRRNRWLSVVFQHWNIRYFAAILDGARDSGGELRAAVSQIGDPIWSMHKKKNKNSVLAGEMILTFIKAPGQKRIETKKRFDLEFHLDSMLTSAGTKPVFGEYLFNQLILAAWNSSSIEDLNVEKSAFNELLENKGWRYDEVNHNWTRREFAPLTLF